MTLRLRSALAIACAIAGFSALALPAQAQTPLIWNGAGTSGVDPYGQGWLYNVNSGVSGWGVPGVLNGTLNWAGPDSLFSFSVTFDALPGGVSINTPNADDNLGTRLSNVPAVSFWTANLDAPNTVTFTAPTVADELVPGTKFYANVTFTGDPANSPFTVSYNNAIVAVPEANSLALALPALGMVGAVVIAKRRKK